MDKDVCWIETVGESDARGETARIYQALKREDGTVHNLYKAFSGYPQATVSADRLYKDVMHTADAPLPLWLAELISIQVAHLAQCTYAFTHHGANFLHLYAEAGHDDGDAIVAALKAGDKDGPPFDAKLRAILNFGEKLALKPQAMRESDIVALRDAGLDDGEISQVVQVAANFAYWVRVINAFGIQLGDERVGKY
jgi:uncharacterized peroxidase-related enzyme